LGDSSSNRPLAWLQHVQKLKEKIPVYHSIGTAWLMAIDTGT